MASDPMAQDIIRCDTCIEETFTGITPAEVVCKTCNFSLCKVCMAQHISSQPSVKHDISEIGFYSSHVDLFLPTCLIHQKYKCELNCQDCSSPVCSKCLAGPHKMHYVAEISKVFDSQKEIMEQDNEELEKDIIPSYEKIDAEYEVKISSVSGGYDNFRKSITKQGEEWHRIVDTVVAKHLKDADEMEKEDVAILRRDQSEIQKTRTSAQDVFYANKKSLHSNDTNKVINYKSKNKELKKVTTKTELASPSFSPGKLSEEILSQMFGEIKPSIKTELPAYNIESHSEVPSPIVKQFTDEPKSAEIDSGFDDPFDVCCVPHTEQLYVRRRGCGTINLLDKKGKLLNQITSKSGNTDINLSVTRNGKLLYSDFRDRSVNIVNNGKIDTIVSLWRWRPMAVCHTSTNDLLVTMMFDDKSNSKVARYAGSIVKQEFEFDGQGKSLYSNPICIAENKTHDICVINLDPNRLVVVDKAGILKFRYDGIHKMKKQFSFSPRGLATDSQCCILVSDFFNDCVHILNHDGRFVKYIGNCILHYPTGLSISSDGILYVAHYSKKVKVIRYLK